MEQFCKCAFGGAVVPVGDTRELQSLAGGIDVHVHAACNALSYIEKYLPHACSLLDKRDEPFLGWSVSGSVCLYDDGTRIRAAQDAPDYLRGYSRVKLEYGHSCVEIRVEDWASCLSWRSDDVWRVVSYADSCFGKRRVVLRTEGPEVVRVYLRCPVSSHQDIVEADAHLGDYGLALAVFCCRYFDG